MGKILNHLLTLLGRYVVHHVGDYDEMIFVGKLRSIRGELSLCHEGAANSTNAVVRHVEAIQPRGWKIVL